MTVFAVLAMGTPAVAGEDGILGTEFQVMRQSEVDLGVGGVVGDARFSGMYSGLEDGDIVVLFDPTLILRDNRTGTWLRLEGRNLGLDNRELRLEYERQGDWNLFVDLDQTPKSNPLEITTGLSGIGGPVQRVSGQAKRRVDFETKRDRVTIGLGKLFGRNLGVNLSYRHEEKRGERQWGAQGFNFIADPIDYVTREVTATASYTGKRLQLSAGYLGSFFENDNRVLDNDSRQTQIALPPDNQAHQLYLNGGYSFTRTVRATLKTSYDITLQDEDFFTAPTFAGNDRRDLGGRVDNLLVHLGLTSRPLPKLAVNAKLRYQERDDRTDIAQYIRTTTTRSGLNIPFSRATTTGDVEANYRLPARFRLIAGLRQEHWSRTKPDKRQASFRDNTDETEARVILRRAVTESLGGAVAYTRSVRTGSNWADGTDSRVDPINLGDRDRHKVRATLDWVPSDDLSAQLRLEYVTDDYDSKPLGPRDSETRLVALDLSYALSSAWNVSAWASLSDVRFDQASNGDGTDVNGATVTDQDWAADLRHYGRAVGIGLRGRLMDGLTTGLDAQYTTDRSEYAIAGLGPQELPSLPDIHYRQISLGLFLDYAMPRIGRIRLNYAYERLLADDWTWRDWTYDDGSTVRIPGTEDNHFIGLVWSHRL